MYKKRYFFLSVFLWCILISLSGCKNEIRQNDRDKNTLGYDLDKPALIQLPVELDEISGLAYYEKDTSIFAIIDERGWLYKIFPNRPNDISKWKFANDGDFEDITLIDSNFYVLKSNGKIVVFRFISSDSLYFQEYPFLPDKKGEFEILYYDDTLKKLVLICKDCKGDSKTFVSAYTFDPWSYQFGNAPFTIKVNRIAEVLNEPEMKFKPSAAAIHPITGELYIVSAINKALVVADRAGNVLGVFKLPSKFFKQPEGITFTPSGSMMISNEAADIGPAEILIYRSNKANKP